jgi:hypothetical protein
MPASFRTLSGAAFPYRSPHLFQFAFLNHQPRDTTSYLSPIALEVVRNSETPGNETQSTRIQTRLDKLYEDRVMDLSNRLNPLLLFALETARKAQIAEFRLFELLGRIDLTATFRQPFDSIAVANIAWERQKAARGDPSDLLQFGSYNPD